MGAGSRFDVSGTILEYLRIGHIDARARAMRLTIHDRYGTNQDSATDSELAIPDWFWEKCTNQNQCVLDWHSGIFSGKGYFDGETYQAKFLGVKLRVSDLDVFAQRDETEQSDEPLSLIQNKENSVRPELSDADLNKWWQSKSIIRDSLTKDELLALVRAKFPDNHISRERVREPIGPRKQGPKPLSGKGTAKQRRK
ncbi:hypothetical protein [Parasphingorhabdus sp.]|uniref:hypothetical protein n=1 Tax=Parasphingorhabdus sp. TaxID=2709688 RepID=UPI003D268EE4